MSATGLEAESLPADPYLPPATSDPEPSWASRPTPPWPPPGLERLSGALRASALRGLLATLLAGPCLLWLTLAREPLLEGAGGTILSLLIALGLLVYLGAIMRAAASVDLARRGRRLGYSTGVLLDVLAGHGPGTAVPPGHASGDVELRPRIRETMRRLHRASGLVAVAAGLAPLPLLCLGILLALRGAAGPGSVALLLLAPALLLWATALLLRGYAALLLEWEKGAAAWDPAPVRLEERASDWQRHYDPAVSAARAAAATHAPRASRAPSLAGLSAVLVTAAAGIGCFLLLSVTVMTMGILSDWTDGGSHSRLAEDVPALARIELLRPLGRTPDFSITAAAAGAAYHAYLSAAGDVRPGMLPPSPALPPLWDGPRPAPAKFALLWRMVLGDSASPPLSDWDATEEHPALAQLAVLARATSLDPLAARWEERVPAAEFGGFGRREAALRAAVLRPVRDAALAVRRGNQARAREILRDLLSAGLLLVDHARTPGELRLGRLMAEAGGMLLLELEPADRAAFTAAHDAVARALRRTRTGTMTRTESASDRVLRQHIADAGLYRSIRWDAFRQLDLRLRCGSPAAVAFGGSGRLEQLHDWARETLLASPGDSMAFRALTAADAGTPGLIGSPPRYFRRMLRALEVVGGRRLVDGVCMSALLGGG